MVVVLVVVVLVVVVLVVVVLVVVVLVVVVLVVVVPCLLVALSSSVVVLGVGRLVVLQSTLRRGGHLGVGMGGAVGDAGASTTVRTTSVTHVPSSRVLPAGQGAQRTGSAGSPDVGGSARRLPGCLLGRRTDDVGGGRLGAVGSDGAGHTSCEHGRRDAGSDDLHGPDRVAGRAICASREPQVRVKDRHDLDLTTG